MRDSKLSVVKQSKQRVRAVVMSLFVLPGLGILNGRVSAEPLNLTANAKQSAQPITSTKKLADSPADNRMNIIGNQEGPTVLNVVPWKNKELSVDPWSGEGGPSNTLMKRPLKPIDRDELLREVEYFDTLKSRDSGN